MRNNDWSSDVCSSDLCIGPLIVGELMRGINADTFYMFVSFAAAILVLVVRPARVTGSHLSADAPPQFVPMSDSLQASLVAAARDPRVDLETEVSHDPVVDTVVTSCAWDCRRRSPAAPGRARGS